MSSHNTNLLEIRSLTTSFYLPDTGNTIDAVNDVSLCVKSGTITALIGESGSGKSVTCKSIFHLIDPPGEIRYGKILFQGKDLLKMTQRQRICLYGNQIFMIFQDCADSLNPVYTVRHQMLELLRIHGKYRGKADAEQQCLHALRQAHLADAERVFCAYPFELSGGMCQRVMIAMAFLVKPELLIADEPTTSLDLTIQAGILEELKRMNEQGVSILLITHDIGIVAQMADDLYVMEAGHIVEHGSVLNVFDAPKHPYTKQLLKAART